MTTFVTIHRLLSMPVSLPVRGADGGPKTMPFGGVERQRLSSQSIKAHLRRHVALTDAGTLIGEEPSVRSALIGPRLIAPALVASGMSEEDAATWSAAVMALFRAKEKVSAPAKKKGKAADADSVDETGDEAAQADTAAPKVAGDKPGAQVLVVGQREIAALVTVARIMHAAGIKPAALRALVDTPAGRRKGDEAVLDALAALDAVRAHAGLDGALFGRFVTGSVLSRVDAAVMVGHAITVHPIASAVDFWGAQDSLQERDDGEAGSAHISTRTLSTGVYYMPVVISVDQVRENLAGAGDEEIRTVISGLVTAISTLVPAAMLSSTAPFCGPGEVIVEVGTRQPVVATAAFEEPVEPRLAAAGKALRAHLRHTGALVGRQPTFDLAEMIDVDADVPAVVRLADAVAHAAV